MNETAMDSWWENDDDDPRGRTKRPTKCSCCRKVTLKEINPDTEHYLCRVHGGVVVAEKGVKRSGKTAWHYFRLSYDQTEPTEQRLKLF